MTSIEINLNDRQMSTDPTTPKRKKVKMTITIPELLNQDWKLHREPLTKLSKKSHNVKTSPEMMMTQKKHPSEPKTSLELLKISLECLWQDFNTLLYLLNILYTPPLSTSYLTNYMNQSEYYKTLSSNTPEEEIDLLIMNLPPLDPLDPTLNWTDFLILPDTEKCTGLPAIWMNASWT